MENLNVYAVRLLPKYEAIASGHRACQGCAEVLAVRLVGKALGRNTVVACATGCMEIISSPLPTTSWNVPWIHVAFENAAAVASGVEAGLKVLMRKGRIPKKKVNILAIAQGSSEYNVSLVVAAQDVERAVRAAHSTFELGINSTSGAQIC